MGRSLLSGKMEGGFSSQRKQHVQRCCVVKRLQVVVVLEWTEGQEEGEDAGSPPYSPTRTPKMKHLSRVGQPGEVSAGGRWGQI